MFRVGIHLVVTDTECVEFAKNRSGLGRFRPYFTRVGSIFTRGGQFHFSSLDRLGCVSMLYEMWDTFIYVYVLRTKSYRVQSTDQMTVLPVSSLLGASDLFNDYISTITVYISIQFSEMKRIVQKSDLAFTTL